MQVWWRSGHLSARRSDLRKSLQTDGRTDDGRRAIALAHSWNELKIMTLRFTLSIAASGYSQNIQIYSATFVIPFATALFYTRLQ